jgi:hypothetical protein
MSSFYAEHLYELIGIQAETSAMASALRFVSSQNEDLIAQYGIRLPWLLSIY